MTQAPEKLETMHEGNQIKKVREFLGIKQETLAGTLGKGTTQQDISEIENRKKVDDELMHRVAKALGVPPEFIRKFNKENLLKSVVNNYNFSDNAIQNHQQSTYDESAPINNFNPIEKMVELFERLLQVEKKRNDELEARVKTLESSLKQP